MKPKILAFSSTALTAAVLVLAFADPTNIGLRFFAKFAILLVVLAVTTSLTLSYFFGPNATRKFFSNLVLIGISVSFALLAAELGVRAVFQDVTTTSDNSSYFARRWNELNPPELNELGFRDRTVNSVKPPGTYRIAIIGDSLTYGQGLLTEERFSNLLSNELNKSTGTYEVLNFGRAGAETDDHINILRDNILDFSPDFVLIQWFVNDVEISETGRAVSLRLIPSSFIHAWLHSNSALYYLVETQWASLQSTLGLTENYVNNMTRRFKNPDSEESLSASAALDRLVSLIRDNDIQTGIVLFPIMADVRGDADEYPLGFLLDRVLAFCSQESIPCLDLRPIYAKALSPSEMWVNRLDRHPSSAANKLASEAILAHFAQFWGQD
ncbi:MAG: SGNH/GDSL hydrolase family protein [Gammaproteobacteria bacterium]|nr:SGNH/GDSL hydrolase family protein [Gammaproteobacteria bacterium]NNL51721.1 SGNH/GDSL hydrolase family protein [Woeseiaceae bacterium]